jgi:hypothetical protein
MSRMTRHMRLVERALRGQCPIRVDRGCTLTHPSFSGLGRYIGVVHGFRERAISGEGPYEERSYRSIGLGTVVLIMNKAADGVPQGAGMVGTAISTNRRASVLHVHIQRAPHAPDG